jgi:hypothetical protein
MSVNIVLEVLDNEHSLTVCVRPIVGTTKRLRGTKRRESIVMGTDRCTITSGRWYRIHAHAERGSRDTE